jgi:hypothetical protein
MEIVLVDGASVGDVGCVDTVAAANCPVTTQTAGWRAEDLMQNPASGLSVTRIVSIVEQKRSPFLREVSFFETLCSVLLALQLL